MTERHSGTSMTEAADQHAGVSSRATQTAGRRLAEDIANSVTHGLGFVASIFALPIVVIAAATRRDPWQVTGAAIYGASLIVLYGASTLYHSFPRSKATGTLRVIDHSAIYLLIAGTYTPFALGPLRGPWGWSLLIAVWGLAATGIFLKTTKGFGPAWLSTGMYLFMGWLSILAIRPMINHIGVPGMVWLAGGGLCYTAGVVFYATDKRLRFGHAVWHVFVLAGSACHFVAVLKYGAGVAAPT
ncbi:MAG: hemolysin III family protein [Gemmatimonadaceae bacterium]